MDIRELEAAVESAIASQIQRIKSQASTYREAIDLANRIAWPTERPTRLGGNLLKLVSREVVGRLEEEFQNVPIRK